MRRYILSLVFSTLLGLSACGDEPPVDPPDTTPADAGQVDASIPDASTPDAGGEDASTPAPKAWIEGTASLFGRDDHSGIKVELVGSDAQPVETDASGAYRLEVEHGTHELRLSFGNYFPALVEGLAAVEDETVAAPAVTLRLGRRIDDDPNAVALAASSDEARILYMANCTAEACELWAWDEATEASTLVGEGVDPAMAYITAAWFSPDGAKVAFLAPFSYAVGTGTLNTFSFANGEKQQLGAGVVDVRFSADWTKVAFLANYDGSAGDFSMWDLASDTGHTLCTATTTYNTIVADDWRHALCASSPDAAGELRLWDLETWQSHQLGTGITWYNIQHDPAWTRVIYPAAVDQATMTGQLWLWDITAGEGTKLGDAVVTYSVFVRGGWTKATFLGSATTENWVARGTLFTADLTTKAVTAIDQEVGVGVPSLDGKNALYLKNYDGNLRQGDLWAWNGQTGESVAVATAVNWDLGADYSKDWALYRTNWQDSANMGDLWIWDFRTGTSAALGTNARPLGYAKDGSSVIFADQLDLATNAGNLMVRDVVAGADYSLGSGVSFDYCASLQYDPNLQRAIFSKTCSWSESVFPLAAWSRTGGSRDLGAGLFHQASADWSKAAYFTLDDAGHPTLNVIDFVAGTDVVAGTGVYGQSAVFNSDWSKAHFLGGCDSEPCSYALQFWDAGTGEVSSFGQGLSPDDELRLTEDWSKAVVIVGFPFSSVVAFDVSAGTTAVLAQDVLYYPVNKQSIVFSDDLSRLLIVAGGDPENTIGELLVASLDSMSSSRVDGDVVVGSLYALADGSQAFYFKNPAAVAEQPVADLWAAKLGEENELIPVEASVFPEIGVAQRKLLFRVIDEERGGLYEANAP